MRMALRARGPTRERPPRQSSWPRSNRSAVSLAPPLDEPTHATGSGVRRADHPLEASNRLDHPKMPAQVFEVDEDIVEFRVALRITLRRRQQLIVRDESD